ncbi:hypothetical protein ACTXL6_12420 [Brachybacterium tyrofermentans]|uniref:hypothetical protein n=1 Tax=Brachybacterium tyrofermentans TaxID=47848 RepID=UPI003FD26174
MTQPQPGKVSKSYDEQVDQLEDVSILGADQLGSFTLDALMVIGAASSPGSSTVTPSPGQS